MILENQTIAILTRVNALAERHGIKPYDFIAEVRNGDDTKVVLAFTTVADHVTEKWDTLLDSIAGPEGIQDGTLTGETKEIIDALDQAMAKAPRPRGK